MERTVDEVVRTPKLTGKTTDRAIIVLTYRVATALKLRGHLLIICFLAF